MTKFLKKQSRKIGQPPGTLVHVGEKKTGKATIDYIDYDKDVLDEKIVDHVEDCFPLKNKRNRLTDPW